jgi:1-deoxy-D-xylulose-5-phosphate reductoisomerase
LKSGLNGVNFYDLGQLTFQKPDLKKFPALSLAIEAGRKGGTFPSVLNAADEEAVEAFLSKKIRFLDIYKTVEKVVNRHRIVHRPTVKSIMEADLWAREEVKGLITK